MTFEISIIEPKMVQEDLIIFFIFIHIHIVISGEFTWKKESSMLDPDHNLITFGQSVST